MGDLEGARGYLRQALQIDPDFSWALTNLAELELARGDAAAARGWVDRLLTHDLDHVIGLWTAGTIAAATGEWEEAVRSYGQAYRAAPETRGSTGAVSLRVHLAQALLRTGQRRRAEALLDTASIRALHEIETGSEFPGLRLELAAISGLGGDLEEAHRWMQAAYDAGLRSVWVDQMPLLEPLRHEPQFRALVARIRQDCAAMRARLQEDPAA